VRARLNAWWAQRHPRTDTLHLTQRNVYILPTRSGWAYAGLLAVLLVASINYQLNLGHLLTFALAGAGVVALQATHAVLRGLTAVLHPALQGHAGAALAVRVSLQDAAPSHWLSPMRLGRHAIALRWRDGTADPVYADVAPGQRVEIELNWTPAGRGLQPLPALTLESRFPLGLFRAWTVWRPAALATVWPAPETAAPPWPSSGSAQSAALPQPRRPEPLHEPVEPDGVRPWRRGDSPAQVAWKLSARQLAGGGDLLVREPGRPASDARVLLRWADTPARLGSEARLARLCAWLLRAEQQRLAWTLELPDDSSGAAGTSGHPLGSPGSPGAPGPAHALHLALHRLARWQPSSGESA
jgi:uncharacterized protein (DUF58 family)